MRVPYAGPIAIGFVLALATTVAGLIPPYLTMPLLDDILIPYQQRSEQAAHDTVALGGAAVSASAEAGVDGVRVACISRDWAVPPSSRGYWTGQKGS